jgi:hypothetical protein
MLRFSLAVVAVLTLAGSTTVGVSPALALGGAAYDKCMAKCMKTSTKTSNCPRWCETYNH